jgi:tripartite-type tricarboxylate transporter receptor subunit TctC
MAPSSPCTAVITAIVLSTTSATAPAQAPEDFYRGKEVRMIVGHPTGSDYDIGGRLLAKYLSRHVPGKPTIVVQNLPTAASIMAANTLFNTAPKDGTVFGSFSRNLPSQAVVGHPNLQVDMRRLEWLGAVSRPSRVCVSWHTSRVKRAEDVFEHELVIPGGGASSGLSIVPMILNHALNTRFRIVEGYRAFPDAILALERGEVAGICNPYNLIVAREELVRNRKLNFLFSSEETAVRPDIPSIFKFVKTEEQARLLRFVFSSTEFGRPYAFPPGVPPDRVAAMRTAFKAALTDPDLLQEAERSKLDMSLRPPEDLMVLIGTLYATSPQTLEVVRKLLPSGT